MRTAATSTIRPHYKNMQHFTNILSATMKQKAMSAKSYTPSINKKLVSIKKGHVQDIFEVVV